MDGPSLTATIERFEDLERHADPGWKSIALEQSLALVSGFGTDSQTLVIYDGQDSSGTAPEAYIIEARAGFPCRAFSGRWCSNGILNGRSPSSFHGAAGIPGWLRLKYPFCHIGMFLFKPLLPGLAVNTVAFAGALWLLTAGGVAVVKSRRRHRNRCPACNYDRKGLSAETPCPECGLPIR